MVVALPMRITTFVLNRAQAVRNIFGGSGKCAEQIRLHGELKLVKEQFKRTIKLEYHWRQSKMTNGLKLFGMKHLQNEYSSINGRCIDIFESLDNLVTSVTKKYEDDKDNAIVENGIDAEVVPDSSTENTLHASCAKWIDNLKTLVSNLSDRLVVQMEPIVYGLNPPREYVKPKHTSQGKLVSNRNHRNDTFNPAEDHLALGVAVDAEVPGCSKWTSSTLSRRTISVSSSHRSSYRSSYPASSSSSRSSVYSTSSQ